MRKYRAPKRGSKYYVEPDLYAHAVSWCRCYQSWINKLADLRNTARGISYEKDKVQTSNDFNQTEEAAIKCVELENKINLLENTAREVSPDLWKWIIKGATDRELRIMDLQGQGMPCSIRTYSRLLSKFYYLISERIEV